MKRFIVTVQPKFDNGDPDGGEVLFGIVADNRKGARSRTEEYIRKNEEVKLTDHDDIPNANGEFILNYSIVVERAKGKERVDYEVPPEPLVPFDADHICDECGGKGAFDYGTQQLCWDCTHKDVFGDYNV
jgi:hypothetical protein